MLATYQIFAILTLRSGISEKANRELQDKLQQAVEPMDGEIWSDRDSNGTRALVVEVEHVDDPATQAVTGVHDAIAEVMGQHGAEAQVIRFSAEIDEVSSVPDLISQPKTHHFGWLPKTDPSQVVWHGEFVVGPSTEAIETAYTKACKEQMIDHVAASLDLSRVFADDLVEAGEAMAKILDKAYLVTFHQEDADPDGDAEKAIWKVIQGEDYGDAKELLNRNRRIGEAIGTPLDRSQVIKSLPKQIGVLVEPESETLVEVLKARDLIAMAARLNKAGPCITEAGLDQYELAAQTLGETS